MLVLHQLTCGNVGKGTRLAAHTQSKEYLSRHEAFQVLPGFSDIMYPGMAVGMTGSITGTGKSEDTPRPSPG